MDSLGLHAIKDAIASGQLRSDEEDMARDIIEKHGMATFTSFLFHREKQAQQAHSNAESTRIQEEINRQLGVSRETFAKYGN